MKEGEEWRNFAESERRMPTSLLDEDCDKQRRKLNGLCEDGVNEEEKNLRDLGSEIEVERRTDGRTRTSAFDELEETQACQIITCKRRICTLPLRSVTERNLTVVEIVRVQT